MAERIPLRNLPESTKPALRARAERHRRSVEAETREIIAEVLAQDSTTPVDLLAGEEGADIEFEPGRLGLTGRDAEL